MSFVVNVEEGAEASTADGDKGPEAVDEPGIGLKNRSAISPTRATTPRPRRGCAAHAPSPRGERHMRDVYNHHAFLAASSAQLGNKTAATAHAREVTTLEPGFAINKHLITLHYKQAADREHYREGLIKAGLPE